jgi:Ca2+-transporting ATPase
MIWHTRRAGDVLQTLESSRMGLSSREAQRRLEQYGFNELKEKKKKTPLVMFFDQFRDFMIIVLIVAAVISGFLGELSDTIAIMVIIVLNAVVGFVQEYRAEKAMASLKKMAAPSATVIRDGMPATIPALELVPGDMVTLEAGKVVPADMRLIESVQLKVEEAALTGESMAVEKNMMALPDEHLSIGDRKNMAYKGTFVIYGRGTGIVIATGMDTELGSIAAMLQEEEEVKTPLQKRLALFGRKLALGVLVICALVFSIGITRGEPPLFMLLTAISLAVAAIPEALPAVVTISLALGARKMMKQNALIRRLPAVETLGSVTYICTDKTGTLTLNKMTVEEISVDGKRLTSTDMSDMVNDTRDTDPALPLTPFPMFLKALALNNDARQESSGNVLGDPTEVALYHFAQRHGFGREEIEKKFPRIREIPFDAARRCMTTFHRNTGDDGVVKSGAYVSFTKGAVEVIVEKSTAVLTSKGEIPLNREEVLRIYETMAADGLRTLGIAMRRWDELPDEMSPDEVEKGLIFLGVAGIMDPPREEARDAVSQCKRAGIKPVMITGDHPFTAKVIAQRLGILDRDTDNIITGREIESMGLKEFEERVEQIRVYARVVPEQKLKIVKALQERGQFVAMTGDGVNDAPALKRADIGVAMGIAGTDVAKESADMILLDDNFATIVKAVREGRRIYDNIRKFLKYLLATNSGELWTLTLAPLMGLPVPLLPIQILWINLMTDSLPALALSVEPEEADIMKRPPRKPRENILSGGMLISVLWIGLLMGALSLTVQAWNLKEGNEHWQTMVFSFLCLSQLWNVLAIRSERKSLFSIGILSNKPLIAAVLLSFLLQMAVVYIPFLNPVFKTKPLGLNELMITIGLSSVVFIAVEVSKWIKRGREP